MSGIEGILVNLARLDSTKFLGLIFAAAAVFYFTLYDDGSKYDRQYANIKKRVDEQARIAEQTKALLAEKEQILRSRDLLAQKFKQSLEALPPEIDVAELLRGINSTAKSAGAKIIDIRPSKIQEREFFDQLPIDIQATGTFAELSLFLSYVARLPRIVRIVNYRISVPSRRGGNFQKLRLKGSLLGYRSRPIDVVEEGEKNSKAGNR